MATGSGTNAALYWVHGNHMGVPIVTTDATGAAVTPTGYTMPGFPGQLRTLAGLYYNRHRDYDSSTGRYIQADRIGLVGGSNLYLYAEANPLRYVDPAGTTAIPSVALCFTNPLSAAVCAGVGVAVVGAPLYYGPKIAKAADDAITASSDENCDDDDYRNSCRAGWDQEFNGY